MKSIEDARAGLAAGLAGHVLEVGPGMRRFPTPPGVTGVTLADKPLVGGRDAFFPELKGFPTGPDADVALDLDADGLRAFDGSTFDGAIAAHVLEHLANPVAAIAELHRVVKPGGRIVIVMPDRRLTFDRDRSPTPADHVIGEFDARVTEVDEEHIREFCAALFVAEGMESIAQFHDPAALDDERIHWHRTRSIHVHCWTAEEFAALLSKLIVTGRLAVELSSLSFVEDIDGHSDEFGLELTVLESPHADASTFVATWVEAVLEDEQRHRQRVAGLIGALARDGMPELAAEAATALIDGLDRSTPSSPVASDPAALAAAHEQIAALQRHAEQIKHAPAHRLGRALTSPIRLLRR